MAIIPQPNLFSLKNVDAQSDLRTLEFVLSALPDEALMKSWSRGAAAAEMARIIIKRIASAAEWEQYWRKRLRIEDNVMLIYRGIRAK